MMKLPSQAPKPETATTSPATSCVSPTTVMLPVTLRAFSSRSLALASRSASAREEHFFFSSNSCPSSGALGSSKTNSLTAGLPPALEGLEETFSKSRL